MKVRASEITCGLDLSVAPNVVYFIIDGQRYEMASSDLKQFHLKLTSLLGYFIHPDRFEPPMPERTLK